MIYSLDDIRHCASGQWHSILPSVGVPERCLNTRKHQPCPSCGGRDRFRYTNHQDKGGFICNQCTPNGGSGFDLIMLVCGCEFKQAVKIVANHLGFTPDRPNITPKPFASTKTWKPPKDNIERIKRYLSDCEPITRRSIVGQYLVNRGLKLEAIQDGLHDLLCCSSLDYWAFSDRDNKPIKLGSFPAMVAPIKRDGELMGVHLTYIDSVTKKKAVIPFTQIEEKVEDKKLAILVPQLEEPYPAKKLATPQINGAGQSLPAKKMQARYQGALTGASINLYQSHNEQLAVCEGIETALAVKQLFNLPVWACGSAGSLRAIQLPPNLKTLFIVTDNDENNIGQIASRDLSNRAIMSGVTVKQWTPPTIGHDALDELNRQSRGLS